MLFSWKLSFVIMILTIHQTKKCFSLLEHNKKNSSETIQTQLLSAYKKFSSTSPFPNEGWCSHKKGFFSTLLHFLAKFGCAFSSRSLYISRFYILLSLFGSDVILNKFIIKPEPGRKAKPLILIVWQFMF